MNILHFAAACSASALLVSSVSAQSFTPIPNSSYAFDVSADGETVVGAAGGEAFSWRWRVDAAPTSLTGAGEAVAVSADGSVIAGNMKDPVSGLNVAGRWTQATGWVALGGVGGSCGADATSAYDMSDDGSVIVGLGWVGCAAHGFVWTEANGMQVLELVGNGSNRSSAVSGDGTLAAGFAQGSFNRTPAYWTTGDKLGVVPDMADVGEYHGVNHDGSMLLGTRNDSAVFQQWDALLSAYVETDMGGLNPGWTSAATDVSNSGGTIVGYDSQGFGGEAWVWNPQSGIVGLQFRLLDLGVPGVPALSFANAVSADGKVVVGHTFFQGAWIAEIPPGPIITNYSCGFQNPPGSLVHVSGSPSIGGSFTLGVDDPTGSTVAPAFGVVAFSLAPDPAFPCGTPIPGWGMFSATADLLISVAGGNPFMQLVSPSVWTTPTQTVDVDFFLPLDTNLMGFDLYAQGILFSPSAFTLGLTEGARITIGLD